MDPAPEDPLAAALARIAPPDHLCAIYETAEERTAISMPFLRLGLERGERCVYIADRGREDAACETMRAQGIDVERATARGALLLISRDEAYLRDGVFDPARMFDFWKREARDARRQGFTAVRASGENDWVAAGAVPGIERWMEYESGLVHAAFDCKCSFLCQYNRRLFPAEVVRDVIRTHPLIAYRGTVSRNSYYLPAEEFLAPDQPEREVERLLRQVHERELLENHLDASESYVRQILESVTDNFFALSGDWRFTYLNRHAAEQMRRLGKDPAKLLGKVLWDEFADVPNAATLRRVMRERVTITDELYYAPLREWVENNIYPDSGGGLVTFQRYVTARKRNEELQRRREALLAVGQEISQTGSWSWDASTAELFWSPEHFRIVGLPPAPKAPPLQEACRTIHAEDRPLFQAAFDHAVKDRVNLDIEGRTVHPDGSVRHVHTIGRPVLDAAGRLVEYVGTIIDTTEQKQAEERLLASEQRFRQLAEAIPHHVWTLLPDGSVRFFNQQLADYTGLSTEELRLGGWAALHPADVERVRAAWRHAWATGEQYQVEQRLRGGDGRYRRFMCCAVAVRDSQGRIIEWFGTNTDVEARRQAEEAVNEARAELARVNRALTVGELAASIAHEINQPLAAVVTNAHAGERWLGAATPNIAEAYESLRRISRDAHRASEIIARIRGLLSRRASQKVKLHIDEVIRDVAVLVQREVQASNVQMDVAAEGNLPALLADRVQLQQIILNLVINAVEAMSGVEGARRIELRAEANGAHDVLVSVRDSGIGIDPRLAGRVFDAFYTTKPGGMGMGLSISRSIVEALGGRLWVTSNDGQGATFRFTLPGGA